MQLPLFLERIKQGWERSMQGLLEPVDKQAGMQSMTPGQELPAQSQLEWARVVIATSQQLMLALLPLHQEQNNPSQSSIQRCTSHACTLDRRTQRQDSGGWSFSRSGLWNPLPLGWEMNQTWRNEATTQKNQFRGQRQETEVRWRGVLASKT